MPHPDGLSGRQLLLLEDQAVVGLCLVDAMEEAGLRVHGPMATCAEALGWLRGADADLAVLDIHLADGPCIEVARELRLRRTPFVLFSGSLLRDTDLLHELGDPPLVRKPAGPEAVLAALSLVCAAASAGRMPIAA